MEPDVIRMFSSSPPPMDDAVDEEDEEFGDFGTFSSPPGGGGRVPNSVSFSEFDTPTTFNQSQALNATSPPALNLSRGLGEGGKANGHVGGVQAGGVQVDGVQSGAKDTANHTETLTNGFQGKSNAFSQDHEDEEEEEEEEDFADFAAFSDKAHSAQTLRNTSLDAHGTLEQSGDFGSFEEHDAVQPESANSHRTESEFANFAAFSKDSEGTPGDDDTQSQTHHSVPDRTHPEESYAVSHECTLEVNSTGSDATGALSKDQDFYCNRAREDCSSLNGNALDASGSLCSSDLASESDGGGVDNLDSSRLEPCSRPVAMANGTAAAERDRDGGGSETETETSLGRPLSTEALEEFTDMSTTGSVPSPPFQEDMTTPTGDEEEEEFGDFAQEFANFEQNPPPHAQEHHNEDEEDDFGDFNSTQFTMDTKAELRLQSEDVHAEEEEEEDFGEFGDFNSPKLKQEKVPFPSSESFGNFSSAAATEEQEETGWSAFGAEDRGAEAEGESWAAFSSEEVTVTKEATEEVTEETQTTQTTNASRSERLEKLFLSSFPQIQSPSVDEEAPTLQHLLEPEPPQPHSSVCVGVWAQLLDIHEALGLRFQWGGSFCNKALLCSLGIDTRNILFTGQKKQPVIVPMYAAGLGMLEPVKPVSAAEMIASIAHSSPCSPDSVQEALPPVQFDWSSSGLTNPLDASGGSSLLNLDFFGPVEDSESGAASIPGVDPELFELTTAKMDSSKVTDAFEKLMSSVHTTSTSTTRRPRPEENLSDEALKVISRFPDLSFMTAKVLMFPATLTPRGVESGAENAADRG